MMMGRMQVEQVLLIHPQSQISQTDSVDDARANEENKPCVRVHELFCEFSRELRKPHENKAAEHEEVSDDCHKAAAGIPVEGPVRVEDEEGDKEIQNGKDRKGEAARIDNAVRHLAELFRRDDRGDNKKKAKNGEPEGEVAHGNSLDDASGDGRHKKIIRRYTRAL